MDLKTLKEGAEAFKNAYLKCNELISEAEKDAFAEIEKAIKYKMRGSMVMEDFMPLPLFRDFMNEYFGVSNSSRRYAALLGARGFKKSAKKIDGTSTVGFLCDFYHDEDFQSDMKIAYLNFINKNK